jgi:hypothetical protein
MNKAFSGSWMCDQPTDLLRDVEQANGGEDLLRRCYCPENESQKKQALREFAPYRISGYIWMNDRSDLPGNKMPSLSGLRQTPPLKYHRKLNDAIDPRNEELAADWIISPTTAGKSWQGITAKGRPGEYDTSHMSTPEIPGGAHVLCFDGHLEWRPFQKSNATPIPQGGGPGAPVFWLPNP